MITIMKRLSPGLYDNEEDWSDLVLDLKEFEEKHPMALRHC